MSNKCVKNIYNFIKSDKVGDLADLTKDMNKDGVKKVVNTIKHEARKLLRSDQTLDTQSALDKASDVVTEKMKQALDEDKKNARLNLLAYAKRNQEMVEHNYDAKKLSSVWFSGRDHKGIGARQNLDSSESAFLSTILKSKGSIEPELKKLEGFKFLKDKKNQRDVIDQVLSENYTDNLTGKIARVITKYNHDTVKLMRKHGLTVTELAGRVSRQYHDVMRIMNPKGIHKAMLAKHGLDYVTKLSSKELHVSKMDIAFNKWHDFIKPRLDKRLSLLGIDWDNDSEVKDALRETFDKIITPREGETKGFSLADRIQRSERHLFFKDGGSWVDYQENYGAGNVLDSIYRDARSTAHSLALTDRFGANPEQTLNKLTKSILEKNPKAYAPTLKAVKHMKTMMRYLKGEMRSDSDTWLGSFVHNIQSATILVKMGLSTLNVFGDVPNQWRTMSTQFDASLGEKFNTIFKSMIPDDNRKEFYQTMGVLSNHFVGSHRFSSEMSDFSGKMSKAVNTQMNWNGLKHWDKLMRKASFAGWGNALARRAHLSFDKLDDATKNTLNTYGFTPGEWDIWRKGHQKLGDKNSYLSPDTVLDASNDDMKKTDLSRDQLYQKALSMYHDSYRFTIPSSDISQRAFQGSHGPLTGLMFQFKSYAIGFMRNILHRDIALGGGFKKFKTYKNIISTISGIMLASYISDRAKHLVSNTSMPSLFSNNPKERANAEYMWTHSMLSSLGMYGDAIGALTGSPNKLSSQILGPGAGVATSLLGIIQEMTGSVFGDKHQKKKLSSIMLSSLKTKNVPVINTPLAQIALNYGLALSHNENYESQMNQLHQKYGVTPLVQ